MSTSTDTKAVHRDVIPSVERIEQLAQRIFQGDIILPKFQRDFVWTTEQVLELLDSVYKNFPIGSALLWIARERVGSDRQIADLAVQPPRDEYPVNYLLDGQQRLSSICGVLFWDGTRADSIWNVGFDGRSEQFQRLESLDDPPQHVMRMNKLPDAVRFFAQIAEVQNSNITDKDRIADRSKKLFNQFKDYKMAVVTLSGMSLREVGPIFERINSMGTRLTTADLMRAALWSENFDLFDSVDQILVELEDKEFHRVERGAILRNLAAALKNGFSAEAIDGLRDIRPSILTDTMKNVGEAYRRACDFCATELKVPGVAALPYMNQLVVLAEIFRRIPTPSSSQTREIKKWFWNTTASAHFGGWNTGGMADDYRRIDAFCSGDLFALRSIKINNPPNWKMLSFRRNNAASKLLALILNMRSPRDLAGGHAIDVGKSLAQGNYKEFHHLFPVAAFKGDRKTSAFNSLANIFYIKSETNKLISSKKPSIYLPDYKERLGADFPNVWHSLALDESCLQAALRDDFDAFIDARAKLLSAELNTLTSNE